MACRASLSSPPLRHARLKLILSSPSRQFLEQAATFDTRLTTLKQSLGPPNESGWYPYDSIGNLETLGRLLGEKRTLADIAVNEPVLDLGCGDGALSFFLESLGCEVDAVDWPDTNYNAMRGVCALKQALNSRVAIHEVDLDSQFTLPQKTYGFALFLGILYHLKNPFHALEKLARQARYCILSTRVAQQTPKGAPMGAETLVYLLGDDEANQDSTNFWIFSPPALRLLAQRAGWEVCAFLTAGCTTGSDPAHPDRDERAYCLLESRETGPRYPAELLSGWHELQDNWRWTAREFSVSVGRSFSPLENTLDFRFHLHPDLAGAGPVQLSASVEGVPLQPAIFREPGDHTYRAAVPAYALDKRRVRIDFSLDRYLSSPAPDERELGLIVSFYRPRLSVSDANLPLTFS